MPQRHALESDATLHVLVLALVWEDEGEGGSTPLRPPVTSKVSGGMRGHSPRGLRGGAPSPSFLSLTHI